MPPYSEAGFFMIEAVVAIALIAVCAGAVMGAVLAMQHQSVMAQSAAGLTLSAQNVLTDLRAAAAYDTEAGALAGGSAAFDAAEPAPSGGPQLLHVVVSVVRSAASGRAVATVTVRNALGQAATAQSQLMQEAPAPGSVLPVGTPAPDALTSSGGTAP